MRVCCCLQLDAKNSPLALLAQTCSSIGKDPTPPLQPAANPSTHKLTPASSSKDSSSSTNTHHHHHHHHHGGKDDKLRPRSESPHSRGTDEHRAASKCSSSRDRLKDSARAAATGSASGKGQSPPKTGGGSRGCGGVKDLSERGLSPVDGVTRSLMRDKPTTAAGGHASSSSSGLTSSGAAAKSSATSSSLFDVGADSVQRFAALHQQLSLAVAAAAAAGRGSVYGAVPPHFPIDHHVPFAGGAGTAAAPTTPAPLYPAAAGGGAPFPLLGPQMDAVQLQQLYAAAAAAQSSSLYADYASRLKAACTSSSVGACKDPFCVRCPLGAGHSSSVSSSSTAAGGGGSGTSLLPSVGATGSSMLGPPLPFLPAASLHALLLQQMSAAAAAAAAAGAGGSSAAADALTAPSGGGGGGAYTCSWVDGAADFCGLRFNSSDDLLQHLRVHASAADPSGASLPPHPAALAALTASFPLGLGTSVPRLSPVADVQPPAASASAFGPMPAHGLSPSSSRYHPYKSPGTAPAFSSAGGVPSLTTGLPGAPPGAPPLLPPALAAFYSPYAALYGHRLGAAAVGP